MDHPKRNMENSRAEGDMDYVDPTQEVSEGKNLVGCLRDYSYDILANNRAADLVLKICPGIN